MSAYNIHIYTRSMLGIWSDIFQDAENGQSLTKPYSRLSLGHFLLCPGWSRCILPMRMTFAVLSCYKLLWLQVGHMNKCDSHNITFKKKTIKNIYILETSDTSLQPMSPSRSPGRSSDKTSRQASVQSSWASRYSTTRSPPFRIYATPKNVTETNLWGPFPWRIHGAGIYPNMTGVYWW